LKQNVKRKSQSAHVSKIKPVEQMPREENNYSEGEEAVGVEATEQEIKEINLVLESSDR
jgi:hypothetical protein